MSVIPGNERLRASTALDGRRAAASATRHRSTASCRTSPIACVAPVGALSAIFGPQHGFLIY